MLDMYTILLEATLLLYFLISSYQSYQCDGNEVGVTLMPLKMFADMAVTDVCCRPLPCALVVIVAHSIMFGYISIPVAYVY
jgi:hypothetical protein